MTTLNRIVYLVLNAPIFLISLINPVVLVLSPTKDWYLFVSVFVALGIGLMQLYGALQLFKKKFVIPIIATSLLIISFDFIGFKFITSTLLYLKMELFSNFDFVFNFQLFDGPRIDSNFSFKEFRFNMIGINLIAILQVLFLYVEKKQQGSETVT